MKLIRYGICLLGFYYCFTAFCTQPDWGFFAHRRINRLAVFSLPEELVGFYKKNIEYITGHATDPDMRRYVVPIEGQKHFIDLDRWGELPRNFVDTRRQYAEAIILNQEKDTLRLSSKNVKIQGEWNVVLKGNNFQTFFGKDSIVLLKEDYNDFFYNHIYYYEYFEEWKLNCDSIQNFFQFHGFEFDCTKAYAVDTFVQHGVLPYHLVRMQNSLSGAMLNGNIDQVLRLSADFGHYIGDAHVPLHTTSNYNGQETDQVGIHAFWETRLPELFADENYDYFVGQAEYIDDPIEFYWNVVEESHALVDDVLMIEKELSKTYPQDQQDCFVERGEGQLQNIPCEEYAKTYHEKLDGQVEARLRAAIHTVASAWYTAWVDAGQPNLLEEYDNRDKLKEMEELDQLKEARQKSKIFGREHGG